MKMTPYLTDLHPSLGPRLELRRVIGGFPGGAVVENLPDNAGDMGLSPGGT